MKRSLPRPSASMVVSIFALVVATSGASYAAVKIDGGDIAKGTVTSKQIANETIKSVDVKDGSLAAEDLGIDIPGETRWALVGIDGTIQAQSGGFTIVAAYPTLGDTDAAGNPVNPARANGNVYINAGEDLSDNGLVASIVLQNTIEQNDNMNTNGRAPGADVNPEFSGEISISRCNFTGNTGPVIPTNCAPSDAQNASSFVVSPRLSDGSVTTDGNRKAFYVIVTG